MNKINSPFISIIIPVYNAAHYLPQTLDSVLQQTEQNFEILILDDYSIDDSFLIAQNYAHLYPQVHCWQNPTNLGVAKTRNRGVKKAQGEWIAFLDADDQWKPTKLAQQRQVMLENSTAQFIFTEATFCDQKGQIIDYHLSVPKFINYHKLLKQNKIPCSSVLIAKSLLVSHPLPDGDGFHEDYATWLAILKTGVVAQGVQLPLIIYRLDKTSKSGNKIKSISMTYRTYRQSGLSVVHTLYYLTWYLFKNSIKYFKLMTKLMKGKLKSEAA
ncbi:glycosyltransferase family 2 protein [Bombilactobacillus thymidiniphilus]|uniref:Glycosyltransferase family 2 protein n=1 Tax=Bombilactobacillus thymidiniphilus TaxID=2923363 RepID=A0ABY4PC71_9LACO|nr:glycosyltransferase family 2 protein [Bombilactobacillus thymidiniphilus]UQS83291.1 glycosyltransferase family 2 protein [Bombilactobacillus thymidiniphilus]